MFEQTAIYAYTLPTGDQLFADPMTLRREILLVTEGRAVAWAKRAADLAEIISGPTDTPQGEATVAAAAVEQAKLQAVLADAAYAAFNVLRVEPTTGHGCTEAAALQLLLDFLGWCEEKKEAAVA